MITDIQCLMLDARYYSECGMRGAECVFGIGQRAWGMA